MPSHERHDLPAHLQIRHVPVQVDPIQALHIQHHVPIEEIVDRHRSHDPQAVRTRRRKPTPTSAVRGAASLVEGSVVVTDGDVHHFVKTVGTRSTSHCRSFAISPTTVTHRQKQRGVPMPTYIV